MLSTPSKKAFPSMKQTKSSFKKTMQKKKKKKKEITHKWCVLCGFAKMTSKCSLAVFARFT